MIKASYSYDWPQNDTTKHTESSSSDTKQDSDTQAQAYVIDGASVQSKHGTQSKLGSVATVVAGGAIALVGVPMLILPGPGLLAIGGGVALIAKGAKGLLGSKK